MRGREAAVPVAVALWAALGAGPAVAAGGDSLPRVASGHRPGPDILYAPPPRAPQLENAGVWRAAPILVSGASAYRDGEFLYQDFLYDDHGAAGVPDPAGTDVKGSFLFSPWRGTFAYPDDPAYAGNAADLVEFRVKPQADATAFRVTLNTLTDPALVGFTVALGSEPAALPWPHGAGTSSPSALFLTVHGDSADLVDAATGAARTPAPSVSVDLERRQIEVRIPHAAWDPGLRTIPMAAGVGLWDAAARGYRSPGLVNLAFRGSEPQPDPDVVDQGSTIADTAVTAKADAAWWRERAQADALQTGDVSAFAADVDFAALATGARDDSGVPRTGWIDRILTSRFSFGQGVDLTKTCPRFPPSCEGVLRGQLQPYTLYVPDRARPARGWGLTLLLHALSATRTCTRARASRRSWATAAPARSCSPPAAAAPTATTPPTRRPTPSRRGPTSPAATGSIPTGPRSPATRWAAAGRTS